MKWPGQYSSGNTELWDAGDRARAADQFMLTHHVADVTRMINSTRFNFSTERDLQMAIADVLRLTPALPIAVDVEVRLDQVSRIDLLTKRGCGIEVKVAGHVGEVRRQVERYLEHDLVQALLLVTSRRSHLQLQGDVITDKPFAVVHVQTGRGF